MTLAAVPTGPVGRVVFLGTPDEAAVVLRGIVDAGIEVVAAVTRPDARRGRGSARQPSPVAIAAAELGVPVAHDHAAALAAHPEVLGVVVAYGVILPAPLLASHALVNLHFSLLPRWRGAAPVERAILTGDVETGVCLMRIVPALDEGGLYACERVTIDPRESATALRGRLATRGTRLVVDSLRSGLGESTPQIGEATYAHKIDAADRTIRWAEPAELAARRVRIGAARGVVAGHEIRVLEAMAVTERDGEPGSVRPVDRDALEVACGEGALRITRLQPPGGKAMSAADWWRGRR